MKDELSACHDAHGSKLGDGACAAVARRTSTKRAPGARSLSEADQADAGIRGADQARCRRVRRDGLALLFGSKRIADRDARDLLPVLHVLRHKCIAAGLNGRSQDQAIENAKPEPVG